MATKKKDQKEVEPISLPTPNLDELAQRPDDKCRCGHYASAHKGGACEKCSCAGFEHASMELVVTKPEHRKDYELIRQMGALSPEVWPDARIFAVRQMFAAEAQNSAQLALFMGIADKHGLDPALHEIWLIQTNKGPKAYAGRDGFLKSASRQPQMYGGIQSGVVYPQDEFSIEVSGVDVSVHHKWSPLTRTGRPHGAYAVVYDAAGHPTYVYRETKKCENLRSTYWSDNVDDAIHNRAIAAGLRRVVPLGGLMIEGEGVIGSTEELEQATHRSTRSRLSEIKKKLHLEDPEITVQDGVPDQQEIDSLLDRYAERYRVTPFAFLAWAKACASVPDDLEEWGPDDKALAVQTMIDTEGMEMVKELARSLAEKHAPDLEKLDLLATIINTRDRAVLDRIIEDLWERRPK